MRNLFLRSVFFGTEHSTRRPARYGRAHARTDVLSLYVYLYLYRYQRKLSTDVLSLYSSCEMAPVLSSCDLVLPVHAHGSPVCLALQDHAKFFLSFFSTPSILNYKTF
jgi:hypothetical protein